MNRLDADAMEGTTTVINANKLNNFMLAPIKTVELANKTRTVKWHLWTKS